MQVIIVGTGKLATELLNASTAPNASPAVPWAQRGAPVRAIVVHAGSGRELPEVVDYCQATQSVLVELSTGSALEALVPTLVPAFAVVLCPNTNILMLKFMRMLAHSGHLFANYPIRLTESHQASKTSTPGTALSMAHALGLRECDVQSVRDPQVQQQALHIPPEHLGRHAFHRITIEDPACSITLETRVYGASPYADGVARIIEAIRSNALEARLYAVDELVERGWL
jgi:4-hydroxy-tetrahydrodipicolinate reductase